MSSLRMYYVLLPVLVIVIGSNSTVKAQTSAPEKSRELHSLSGETRIWTGTAGLRWYNFYEPTLDGLVQNSNTELDVEFRHIWMINGDFGWGLQGMTQIYMTGMFGNVGLGNAGFGPLLRAYPWHNKQWQFYLQGGILAGYDLALSDPLEANRSEFMKYRFGLRSGMTYRVSDSFGIYLEIGPDWETDSDFEFGARALQFDVGIQLYRF